MDACYPGNLRVLALLVPQPGARGLEGALGAFRPHNREGRVHRPLTRETSTDVPDGWPRQPAGVRRCNESQRGGELYRLPGAA